MWTWWRIVGLRAWRSLGRRRPNSWVGSWGIQWTVLRVMATSRTGWHLHAAEVMFEINTILPGHGHGRLTLPQLQMITINAADLMI